MSDKVEDEPSGKVILEIPTTDILDVIQKLGMSYLKYDKNPSFETCQHLIETRYDALAFIKNQTDELCEFAVNLNPRALEYVKNKTFYLCNKAIKKNGLVLKYVPDEFKTKEMYDEAVKSQCMALRYVPNEFKTKEMCYIAINNGLALEYVPNKFKTEELCNIAVKDNSAALEYVPNEFKTFEMCSGAVSLFASSIEFIPEEMKTEENYAKMFKYNQNITNYLNVFYKSFFKKIKEIEIDECAICNENKQYFLSYVCEEKHLICLDCAPTITKCYYKCMYSGYNFDILYENKNKFKKQKIDE